MARDQHVAVAVSRVRREGNRMERNMTPDDARAVVADIDINTLAQMADEAYRAAVRLREPDAKFSWDRDGWIGVARFVADARRALVAEVAALKRDLDEANHWRKRHSDESMARGVQVTQEWEKRTKAEKERDAMREALVALCDALSAHDIECCDATWDYVMDNQREGRKALDAAKARGA